MTPPLHLLLSSPCAPRLLIMLLLLMTTTGCAVQPVAYRGVPDDFTLSVEVATAIPTVSPGAAPFAACEIILFPDGSLHASTGNPRTFPGQARVLDQQQMRTIYNLAHAALAEAGASNLAYSTVNGELLEPPLTGHEEIDGTTSHVRIWMRALSIESSHDWQISAPLPPPALDALIANLRTLAYLGPSP